MLPLRTCYMASNCEACESEGHAWVQLCWTGKRIVRTWYERIAVACGCAGVSQMDALIWTVSELHVIGGFRTLAVDSVTAMAYGGASLTLMSMMQWPEHATLLPGAS